MARTAITLISQTANGVTLNNAGTAVDQANGMTIALPTTAVPAGGNWDRLLIYVTNTAAATKTVTIRAGVNGGTIGTYPGYYNTNDPNAPAFRGGLGDLVTGNLTATTGIAFIGPFDVSRFAQSDGSLAIDFSAGFTGTIWAILLPRAF